MKTIAILTLMFFLMGSAALAAMGQVYIVKLGDTLWRIVQTEYGVGDPKIITFLVTKVAKINLIEADKIRAGDKILLPSLSSLLGIEMEREVKNEQAESMDSSPAAKTGLETENQASKTFLAKTTAVLLVLFLISFSTVLLIVFFRKGRVVLPLKIASVLVVLVIMLFANCRTTSSGASFDISDFRYSTRELSYNPLDVDGAPSKETQLKEKEEDELAEKRAALYKDILTIYYVQANSEAIEEDEWLDSWLGAGDLFKHKIIPVEEREREAKAFNKYLKKYEPMEKSYYRRMGRYHNELIDVCEKYGLNPVITTALMWIESRGFPNAVSPAGALGLLQLMPDTAKTVFEIEDPEELFDIEININLGSRYLLSLWSRFGNFEKALAGYNWGPSNVRLSRNIPERIRKEFIRPVLWSAEIFSRPMLKNANYFDLFLWQKV